MIYQSDVRNIIKAYCDFTVYSSAAYCRVAYVRVLKYSAVTEKSKVVERN